MTEALIVLNPRRIPQCMGFIEALTIPKCYLSCMTEIHAADHFNAIIKHGNFDRYLILSDDTTPTQAALDKVLELHSQANPVVTGYSNLDAVRPEVNLCRNVLPAPPPMLYSYDLLTQTEVDAYGDDPIPTSFAGFSLTCMNRDIWLDHPLQASTSGGQMDYMLSWNMQEAGIPIVSHKDTFVHHVKELWNHSDAAPEKCLLVGHFPPEIKWSP